MVRITCGLTCGMSTSVGDRACIPGPERSWHKTETKSVAGSSVGQFNDIKFDDIKFDDIKFDDIMFNDIMFNDNMFNYIMFNYIMFNDIKSNDITDQVIKLESVSSMRPHQ